MSKLKSNWEAYSQNFNQYWVGADFQQESLQLSNGHQDKAQVIFYHTDDYALKWMRQNVPALNHQKPIECIKTDDGILYLKKCLMRFPC